MLALVFCSARLSGKQLKVQLEVAPRLQESKRGEEEEKKKKRDYQLSRSVVLPPLAMGEHCGLLVYVSISA